MYSNEAVPVVSVGGCYGNGYGNSGWGNSWEGIIGLAVVAALFGGWGGNGFGFGGNRGGAGYEALGYELGKVATTNDVASGFNNSAVLSSLNDIKLGQSQMTNFTNQGFAGLNTQLLTGFHGVDNAICTLGYQNQMATNGISREIADCCCNIRSMILENRYLNEKQTCDIITAANSNTQRIIDMYTSDKIDTLNRKLAVAEGQLSNQAQTTAIISALKPCPSPAYVVPNPNCCYTTCGSQGFATIQ